MKQKLVRIDWTNPNNDWPWFYLLETNGEFVNLQGADYPDGSAKHDGDSFWVHHSEIKFMRDAKN